MKRMIVLCLVGAATLAGANLALAHHSFTAAYDNTKRVEVEGVVKEFVWRNPHSFIRIDVTNKEGVADTWNLEWGSSSQLTASKYPVSRTTIKLGDKIIAAGEPRRDPSIKGLRVFSIKRPADGWLWEGVVD
ncbi:MAG: hypothetical protein HOP16_02775 [Acidobacteria bacterium]|nr:hypothetical protein [Acidobacteriota bacterium]